MSHQSIKRVISVFLSLIIVSCTFVFGYAATALKASNVSQWPTLTYKNADGVVHYGQTLEEALVINDDEIVLDASGNQVAGHFEFMKPGLISTPKTGTKANIKFVPDNTDEYTGFNKLFSSLLYDVEATTPVYVDEENNPLVGTEVEAGAKLSTSILSGGTMTNPYNAEEPNILAATWAWVSPDTIVQESGYYEAVFYPIGYTRTTAQVYVKVAGYVPNSAIETMPVINVTYDPDLTWGEVTIEGGKAVIKDSTTEVEGTFAVTDKWTNTAVKVGTTEIDIKFTPADETIALPYEFKCPVTVNKAIPTFKTDDESGIPTITMPYGTKLDSSLDAVIEPLVDVDAPVYLSYKDMNGEEFSYSGTTPLVGTHEIQVKVNVQDSNYEQYTMLTFKLEITGFTANCIMKPIGSQGYKILDTSLKYDAAKPTGTFTVSYTVDGVKQPDITVKYEELFQVEKSKSGKYEFSVKYNEIENDPFEIADITYSTEEKLERNVKSGDSSKKYTYGDKVTLTAPATDPAQPDKPYYGFAGWDVKGNIGLSDEELENAEISFAMPDEDVEINATYEFSLKLFFEWIWQQIVQFFTFIMNACKDLFELAVAA